MTSTMAKIARRAPLVRDLGHGRELPYNLGLEKISTIAKTSSIFLLGSDLDDGQDHATSPMEEAS
jgi:hypothetical protein